MNLSPLSRVVLVAVLVLIVVGVAFCLKGTKTTSPSSKEEIATLTITHPLVIRRHSGATLSDSESDSILGLGNAVLAQCMTQFSRRDAVLVAGGMPSVINNSNDFGAACAASGPTPLGVPRNVRVVNGINWCGSIGPGIIGCANTPGVCMVVKRFTQSMEGILWAHEFGHTKGLPHRPSSVDAVMYPSIATNRTVFTPGECNALRTIGFTAEGEPMAASADARAVKLPIAEFVRQTYVHGVPYDEARTYTGAEVATVVPMLSDTNEAIYWSNVASVVGIVADANAFTTLRTFIERGPSGVIPMPQYDGKVAAIISLGYAANGGAAGAETYLTNHTTPASWKNIPWMAPYHANADERNAELASAAVLGLSLIGSPAALQALLAFQHTELPKLSQSERKFLEPTVKQAIEEWAKVNRMGISDYRKQ